MKSTGIVRGVDGLGRIVLPKELRTSMKLDNDAKLEIFVYIRLLVPGYIFRSFHLHPDDGSRISASLR